MANSLQRVRLEGVHSETRPFTLAPNTSQFVRETHQAVNDYNKWSPTEAGAVKIKDFIDNLAEKYSAEDDNRQFVNGTSVAYNHPPVEVTPIENSTI